MKSINEEHFELVAKRCPSCNSLVMARIGQDGQGESRYADYQCSECNWTSPAVTQQFVCR